MLRKNFLFFLGMFPNKNIFCLVIQSGLSSYIERDPSVRSMKNNNNNNIDVVCCLHFANQQKKRIKWNQNKNYDDHYDSCVVFFCFWFFGFVCSYSLTLILSLFFGTYKNMCLCAKKKHTGISYRIYIHGCLHGQKKGKTTTTRIIESMQTKTTTKYIDVGDIWRKKQP